MNFQKVITRLLGTSILAAAIWLLPATNSFSPASAQETRSYAIGPGPLDGALNDFGLKSGVTVIYDTRLAAGLTTSGVSGQLSDSNALAALLSGTGLTSRWSGDRAVTLIAQSTGGFESVLDDELLGEDIVVEGELLERTVQDSPTSVYIERGEDIELRGDQSALGALAPAGNVSQSGSLAIRGIGQGGVGRRTISVTADGARLSNFISTGVLSSWDLDQVEILRGPQSTQTGRNALGGAVVIRYRDPIFEDEIRTQLAFETADGDVDARAAFAYNKVLIEEELALRISVDGRYTNGFVINENINDDEFARRGEGTLRAALRWEPTEDFSATLKYTSVLERSNPDQNTIDLARFQATGDRVNTLASRREVERTQHAVNLRMSYDIDDDWRVESETTHLTREFLIDSGASSISVLGLTLPIDNTSFRRDNRSFEQEVRLVYDTEQTQAVAGLFYTDTTINQYSELNTAGSNFPFPFNLAFPPGATVNSSQNLWLPTTNYAVFGEIEHEILPGLHLTLGARYDHEVTTRLSENVIATNPPGFVPAALGALASPLAKVEATYEAFLPKASIFYDFTDDISAGFTFQQGYRAGGAATNLFRLTFFEFGPEFTNNYEASFRSQFFDNRLTVNANAYFTEWKDQQVQVALSANPGDLEIVNAGKSTYWGGELEVQAQATDSLSLYGSIGYSQTEFQDFEFNGIQLAGNEFAFAPEWSGSIGGRYDFDNGLWLAADANYASSAFSDIQNTLPLKSRFFVNAQVGYEWDNWTIVGYIDNVLNNEVITSNLGSATGTVASPREFGLLIQAEF